MMHSSIGENKKTCLSAKKNADLTSFFRVKDKKYLSKEKSSVTINLDLLQLCHESGINSCKIVTIARSNTYPKTRLPNFRMDRKAGEPVFTGELILKHRDHRGPSTEPSS